MNSVSRLKIVAGYVLLLGVLLFTLLFVRKEMDSLLESGQQDMQWTDSLFTLLREKDENTIRMLRSLSEVNSEGMISTDDIELIMAEQDTLVARQRVQRRVITHSDTLKTPPGKRGFFRRLKEAFVPSHKDTSIQVKTSLEFAFDTIIDTYNPVDSLHERLREVTRQKAATTSSARRRNNRLRQMDLLLTSRIDSLLQGHEQQTLERARQESERRRSVRLRSVRVVGGIAVGAVLLAALFLVLIGRDVARSNRYRRQLEEARRRAEELLDTREKMMLAITHDFKAPLGSIMGYADLLARLTTDERQRFYLDNMKTSSEHLLKLVTDLLDFHRLDLNKAEVHRVTFHPARLLEEIRVSFEPLTAAKGLALQCDVAPELEGTYISDPLRLRQIVTNLLSNAVKFTERGTVSLSARYAGRRLVVSVADTGKGMDPADRERIFQEFTRLSGAQGQEGFGLGLSIVRRLVQLLEGSIEVESTPGRGSTFTLRVPLYPVQRHSADGPLPGDAADGGKEAATDEATRPAVRHILLIDDDRIQLTLTAAMLRQHGMEAVCCLQLDELLDALRTGTFDLLLTDVQMPAINGFDLLRLLRASNIGQARSIPVIAVTARSDMRRDEFTACGFAGCLHKPFTVQELLQEVDGGAAPPVVPSDAPSSGSASPYNLDALTAFSGDDPAAAASILESFFAETRQNADHLRRAAADRDADRLAAVAHKMLPLFKLIEARQLSARLTKLEAGRGSVFTGETEELARLVLEELELVVNQNSLHKGKH